jgi:hypothetical protein
MAATFREDVGLASDPGIVALSLSDAATYSDRRFGVPLTPEEAADVRGQIEAQDALMPAAEAATNLSGFASAYFTGPTLHVVVTGDAAAAREALAPMMKASLNVAVERGLWDKPTLDAAQASIIGDPGLAALGARPTKVAVDPVTSTIEVTFNPSQPVEAATRLLQSDYPGMARVLISDAVPDALACNSRNDCGTKGGLGAHHNSPALTCSTGFVGKVNGGTLHRMLTAGNCIDKTGGVTNSYPWTNYLGTLTWGQNADWLYGATEDIGTFWIGSTTSYNQYFAGGTADIRTVRSTEATNAQMPVGTYVCRSAHTTGWACGTVHRANISATYDGFIHYGLWEVTPQSSYGDSGAGFVGLESDDSYVIPFGILVAGDTGTGIYTYYLPVNNDGAVYVHVCTTAAC